MLTIQDSWLNYRCWKWLICEELDRDKTGPTENARPCYGEEEEKGEREEEIGFYYY